MISDNKDMAERRLSRRSVASEGKWWSDSQKLECVKTFLMTGNLAMTARVLKIPDDTVRRWTKSTWWKDIVADLRIQDELTLSTRLKKIVEKSMDVIEDRLEHGDYVYDQKSGEMRRKPVAMRDAHKVGLDLDSRRDLVLQRAAPVASVEQIDDKLNKLAQKFADIVNGRKQAGEIVDVEVNEVVQDESIPDEVLFDDGQDGFGEVLQEDESGNPDLTGNSGITGDFGGYQVVWVDTKQKPADVVDTVVHEGVHVYQHMLVHIGEASVGKESQAYGIAYIETALLGDLSRQMEQEEDALHDQRQARLQEGKQAVQLEAGADQSSIGENGYPEAS